MNNIAFEIFFQNLFTIFQFEIKINDFNIKILNLIINNLKSFILSDISTL